MSRCSAGSQRIACGEAPQYETKAANALDAGTITSRVGTTSLRMPWLSAGNICSGWSPCVECICHPKVLEENQVDLAAKH